jgi:cobalamin biosynthesis Mg chelatase CobN
VNEDIAKEILDALFSSLEELETQNAAVLQLLKDKGLASEDDLAAHLEQAGNASNVKWRAARVRIDHLVSSAIKAAEREAEKESKKEAEKESAKATDNRQEFPPSPDGETTQPEPGGAKQGTNDNKGEQQSASSTNSKDDAPDAIAQKNQSQATEGAENEREKTGAEAAKNAA